MKEAEANEQHKSIISALRADALEWEFGQINFVVNNRGFVVESDFHSKLKKFDVVSRAKWWTLKKCSHEFGPIKRIGRTAAVFYPDWRTPSVHHKKGRPSTSTSHESRQGNPSFCIFWPPHLR